VGGNIAPLRASFPHNRRLRALFFALYALNPRIQRKKCAQMPILRVILRYPPNLMNAAPLRCAATRALAALAHAKT